jgi:hypothetical protein
MQQEQNGSSRFSYKFIARRGFVLFESRILLESMRMKDYEKVFLTSILSFRTLR